MRARVMLAVCSALAVASGQWLETTIPAVGTTAFCYNPFRNKLYCLSEYSCSLLVIDGASNEIIGGVGEAFWSRAMCYDLTNDLVYYTTGIESGCPVRYIRGEDESVGQVDGPMPWPDLMVCKTSGNRIYCAPDDGSRIYIIDGSSNQVIRHYIAVNFGPCALELDSARNRLYCLCRGVDGAPDSALNVIDCGLEEVLVTVPLAGRPVALARNTRDNRLFCALFTPGPGSVLDVIDCSTYTVLQTIGISHRKIDVILYAPAENKVYCGLADGVVVVDAGSGVILKQLPLGPTRALLYNSLNHKVYCANDGAVSVVSARTDSVVAAVPVCPQPEAFGWNPQQNRVYVGSSTSDTIYVIADSQGGIEERVTPDARRPTRAVRGVWDACGRRVRAAGPGVYFVVGAGKTVVVRE